MSAQSLGSAKAGSQVLIEDEHVVIRNLAADGAIVTLAREVLADGRDLEPVVREALQVGAAVLLHGSAKPKP